MGHVSIAKSQFLQNPLISCHPCEDKILDCNYSAQIRSINQLDQFSVSDIIACANKTLQNKDQQSLHLAYGKLRQAAA